MAAMGMVDKKILQILNEWDDPVNPLVPLTSLQKDGINELMNFFENNNASVRSYFY